MPWQVIPRDNVTFILSDGISPVKALFKERRAKSLEKDGYRLIFVAYITTRTGRRLYAWQYGRRCWAIWVKA
ncbi:MAG: hypothetical protein A2Z47_15130 [Thermodesulfovibrio sp. RBG_19FT_COMBO_42_12]|nr:MAG: hypothetical protein A2Z47_15130 [Thermodesulfovibrio sp. RBG_19FT_COMBO_42_12]